MPLTVTAINPVESPVAGGAAVTITGTGFAVGDTVTIGGAPATSVVVVSAVQLTAVAPAHAIGEQVDVVVAGLAGPPVTGANLFHYYPEVASITPVIGGTVGGVDFTITGAGFVAGMTVRFGAAAAVINPIVSSTQITGRTPANAPGRTNVDVINAVGGRGGREGNGFEFTLPLVNNVTPYEGPAAGGTDITIRGKYFGAGTTVDFGGTLAAVFNQVSSEELTARTPAHAAGTVAINVVQTDGNNTAHNSFTFLGAEVTAVNPARGPAAGATAITITGRRFGAGTTVTVGGVPAINVVVAGDGNSITAQTAAAAAAIADVVVQNVGDPAVTLAGAFTLVAGAGITEVEPDSGVEDGGTSITITGHDFTQGAQVAVGGVPATDVTLVSSTTLTATTGAHAGGNVDVTVTNADGATATAAGAFTYANITSATPTRGLPAGGTRVVILGAGFPDVPTVDFGADAGANIDRRSAEEIAVDTPAHAEGTVDVTIGGGLAPMVLADAFTFSSVTGVEPVGGPVAGGTAVTISGEGFTALATVSFGATPAAALNLVSATELLATAPNVVAGPVDVVVHLNGIDTRVAQGYTFQDPATVTAVDPNSGRIGTNPVTITGTGFVDGATVQFGVVAATDVVVVSGTTITATAPLCPPPGPGAIPPVDVIVTNPNSAAVAGVTLYTYRRPPTVTAIAPAEGPIAGGRTVTITGTNFIDGMTALIDGVELTEVAVTNATTLQGRVVAHAAGPCNVVVRYPGEPSSAPLAGGFAYRLTPTETGGNGVTFILDGEDYFAELRTMFENVRQARPAPDTYIRLAFWMIESSVTLGDRTCFEKPDHTLLAYIDRVVRAGHDVDIIIWRAAKYERLGIGAQTAAPNEAFAQAVYDLDLDAAGAAGAGRARVFLEHYEGEVGASNHQKIAIASVAGQRVALVGGINLSNHYFAPSDHDFGMTWHDTAVRLEGPATDDIEAEWMRRWKRTSTIADRWIRNIAGEGGVVHARNFGFWSSVVVRQQAVAIYDNTTPQPPHADNRGVSIALTRSEGLTRYTYLRDKLIQRINTANQYLYFENYHFTDPDLVRAIYLRQAAVQAAGGNLRVVVFVPPSGGGSGYMTRRSWLQLALRFVGPAAGGSVPCVTQVHYMDENDALQMVQRANCVHWDVQDTYDPNDPRPVVNLWLDNDALVFRTNAIGAQNVRVTFDKITNIVSDMHFFTSVRTNNLGTNIYTHSKIAIIDDQWLCCGTSNWSFRSMQYDGEIAAMIESGAVAQLALGRLLGHYNDSTPPAPAITINNIETEALINLVSIVDPANVHLAVVARVPQLNNYAVVPLNHHFALNIGFGRAKPRLDAVPGGEPPSFTWI